MELSRHMVAPFSPFGCMSTAGEGGLSAQDTFAVNASTWADIAWPSANLAFYCPVLLEDIVTVYAIGWQNGNAVSGNADAGIYDTNGTRLLSAGSTAQSGTSAPQVVTLGTPVVLNPGLYYMAAVLDNTTGHIVRCQSGGAVLQRVSGVQQQASALPLPSTATFAAGGTNAQTALIMAAIESATF
jgi:hypothetical protein